VEQEAQREPAAPPRFIASWHPDVNIKRRQITYIVRIWQEPSELAAPGEWRGVLRSLDGRRQWFFKSAEELWDLLTRGEAPAETERGKP